MKRNTNRDSVYRLLFVVYVLLMLWLLFDRPSGWDSSAGYRHLLRANFNFRPFYTIGNYLATVLAGTNEEMVRHCFINLAGNVALFVPAGLLLPRVFPRLRNFFRFFVLCTGAIFLVETAQLFSLRGIFDIDDVILNLFGMCTGFLFFTVAHAVKSKP